MPLHIDDEVSSLSAILLNDDYYHFLLDGRTEADGISILDVEHIIPLKMKTWLDLRNKREQGIHVNSRDIRKHRLDVFRLFPLIRENLKIEVPTSVNSDIQNFISEIRKTDIRLTLESLVLKSLFWISTTRCISHKRTITLLQRNKAKHER